MSLAWLEITNVRNLNKAKIELAPGVNVFFGLNGSGKTSILESAYYLGVGRSYRHTSINPMISNASAECIVRGEITSRGMQHQLAVLRRRSGGRGNPY